MTGSSGVCCLVFPHMIKLMNIECYKIAIVLAYFSALFVHVDCWSLHVGTSLPSSATVYECTLFYDLMCVFILQQYLSSFGCFMFCVNMLITWDDHEVTVRISKVFIAIMQHAILLNNVHPLTVMSFLCYVMLFTYEMLLWNFSQCVTTITKLWRNSLVVSVLD